MTIDEFFRAVDTDELRTLDRAQALLWWVGRDSPAASMSARELCDVMERNGHPKQNVSRLHAALAEDRQTSKAGRDAWRLHPRSRKELDQKFGTVAGPPRRHPVSDSVLPRELFHSTRGYLEKVVYQLNASYDQGLYDCCAVMCRRLLETLLIEVYEAENRASEIKDADGHFWMFGGLLGYFEKDGRFHPSRNALRGLRDFKALGDLAAHNRRFNARKDDIDRVRDGLRIATEELGICANAYPATTCIRDQLREQRYRFQERTTRVLPQPSLMDRAHGSA